MDKKNKYYKALDGYLSRIAAREEWDEDLIKFGTDIETDDHLKWRIEAPNGERHILAVDKHTMTLSMDEEKEE